MKIALPFWRRYLFSSTWRYNCRILIALTGTTSFPWWSGNLVWTIPMTLGVVAAALADLDDRLTGRLRNLLITLLCFCIASISVELLFPWPLWFCLGLALSSWGFIFLGALGQRYATIAFGALLIAVYTMLGVELFPEWTTQPALLIIGALWYNILTLTGHLLFPVRPVQEQLAASFSELANYLDTRAGLFDPDTENNDSTPVIEAAMANSQLVSQLNLAKTTIQSRLRGERGSRSIRRSLHYYFVAQDIHERASSSHIQYQLLRDNWHYTELMFRFQRLMNRQAHACRQLANNILMREKYVHNRYNETTFKHIEQSLNRLQQSIPQEENIKPLRWLLRNLKAIDSQLASIESEQSPPAQQANGDNSLSQEGLNNWNDIKLRFRHHLTAKSSLFRHATRVTGVLCTGYIFIQLTGMHHGYWILLTSLFVCQPNYNATRRRLVLRITGTLAGIILGIPLLWLIPSVEGKLILIVITGMLFFTFRQVQYAQATLFITLLVLLCFSLLGQGFEVILPRLIDTLIGCAFAWAAVTFIWPDWRFRRLPEVTERTLNANYHYLNAILDQYHQGKDNSMVYRIARRDAHNGDAELASVISGMTSEVRSDPYLCEIAFRLLTLNHSFLSYISALGAHRQRLTDINLLQMLDDVACYAKDILQTVVITDKQALIRMQQLQTRIRRIKTRKQDQAPLILQQTELLISLLPEIARLRKKIM